MAHMRALVVGFALGLSQVAATSAADLGLPPMDMPAEPCCVSNWYLKGFLGMTSYDVDGIDSALFKTSDFTILDTGFEGSSFGGLGLGYQFNSWLRISEPVHLSRAR